MKKFFLVLDQNVKPSMVEKNCSMEKNYARIGVNTDDNLTLNKLLKFPTLTMIIRCFFQDGEKLYPQIYLNQCLFESV